MARGLKSGSVHKRTQKVSLGKHSGAMCTEREDQCAGYQGTWSEGVGIPTVGQAVGTEGQGCAWRDGMRRVRYWHPAPGHSIGWGGGGSVDCFMGAWEARMSPFFKAGAGALLSVTYLDTCGCGGGTFVCLKTRWCPVISGCSQLQCSTQASRCHLKNK